MIRDPLADTDLAQLANTLAVALLLPADVVVTPHDALLGECWQCTEAVDVPAVAVLCWRPARTDRSWLFREPVCLTCLPDNVIDLIGLYPTIEIPAVITP